MLEFRDTLQELIITWKYESQSWTHPFKLFTNLSYELATWKTVKQLIQERKILKWDKIINYLFQKEKDKLSIINEDIIKLLLKDLRYTDIKIILKSKNYE